MSRGIPAPGSCKICDHPEVAEINLYLLGTDPEKRLSMHKIATKFGVHVSTVSRHKDKHLKQLLLTERKKEFRDPLSAIRMLEISTELILDNAMNKAKPDMKLALAAIDRRIKQIELECDITGLRQEKRPNEKAEARRKDQLENALGQIVEASKDEKGQPTITKEQALVELLKVDPELEKLVKSGGGFIN